MVCDVWRCTFLCFVSCVYVWRLRGVDCWCVWRVRGRVLSSYGDQKEDGEGVLTWQGDNHHHVRRQRWVYVCKNEDAKPAMQQRGTQVDSVIIIPQHEQKEEKEERSKRENKLDPVDLGCGDCSFFPTITNRTHAFLASSFFSLLLRVSRCGRGNAVLSSPCLPPPWLPSLCFSCTMHVRCTRPLARVVALRFSLSLPTVSGHHTLTHLHSYFPQHKTLPRPLSP